MGNTYKQNLLKPKQHPQPEEYVLDKREINFILENTPLNKQQIIEFHAKFRVFISFIYLIFK